MERENQYTISSVKKALEVLKLFNSTHKSMTLTEISERIDMRKGTMVRVLTTPEEEGFVRYDETSERCSLGVSIYVLDSSAFQFISVVEAARPYLEKVTTELNLIAHLSVPEGEKIVLIGRVVPNADAVVSDLNSKIGGEVEAHNTGAGKVLTVYSVAGVREKIISHYSFESYSERTITDKDEHRRVLDAARKNGYATNEGESEPYLRCITYPIFGYGGKIKAALSLSGIIQYFDTGLEQRCYEVLKEICEKIPAAMGQNL